MIPQRVYKTCIEKFHWKPCLVQWELDLMKERANIILSFIDHPDFQTRFTRDKALKILDQ